MKYRVDFHLQDQLVLNGGLACHLGCGIGKVHTDPGKGLNTVLFDDMIVVCGLGLTPP